MNRYKLKDISLSKLEYGSGAAACEYDGKTRYVRITDIGNEGTLGTEVVSPNSVDDKYLLNDGDVLFARTGATVGKTYLYRSSAGRCIYAGFLIRVVPNQKIIRPDYLYYFTKSPQYKGFVKNSMKIVAQPNINAKQYGDLEFNVPSLEEQDLIIKKLNTISSLIILRRTELIRLDELIKARFVELFGNPVTNPMEWELHRFDSLCKNLDFRRRPITATERETGIYPYYGASGIVDYVADYIFDENILLISEDGANLLMRSTPIAFSVSGKVWVNNHAHVVRFEKMSMQKYVEVFFSLIDISDHITGSAQPKLSQAKLNAMMFPVPSDERLETFLHFVSQVDKSKVAVQKSLDKTQQLFDSLMQKYFG